MRLVAIRVGVHETVRLIFGRRHSRISTNQLQLQAAVVIIFNRPPQCLSELNEKIANDRHAFC